MKATGERAGLTLLMTTSAGWLMRRSRRGGREDLSQRQAEAVAGTVLLWWLEGVCSHCEGRRYELVPGTQIVSDNLCKVCDGAGKEPVHHRMRKELQEPARRLAGEFESLMSSVLSDMASRLRTEMSDPVLDPGSFSGLNLSLLRLRSSEAEVD